jgi:hypothetical protein
MFLLIRFNVQSWCVLYMMLVQLENLWMVVNDVSSSAVSLFYCSCSLSSVHEHLSFYNSQL